MFVYRIKRKEVKSVIMAGRVIVFPIAEN